MFSAGVASQVVYTIFIIFLIMSKGFLSDSTGFVNPVLMVFNGNDHARLFHDPGGYGHDPHVRLNGHGLFGLCHGCGNAGDHGSGYGDADGCVYPFHGRDHVHDHGCGRGYGRVRVCSV